jgi:hypothetical protein
LCSAAHLVRPHVLSRTCARPHMPPHPNPAPLARVCSQFAPVYVIAFVKLLAPIMTPLADWLVLGTTLPESTKVAVAVATVGCSMMIWVRPPLPRRPRCPRPPSPSLAQPAGRGVHLLRGLVHLHLRGDIEPGVGRGCDPVPRAGHDHGAAAHDEDDAGSSRPLPERVSLPPLTRLSHSLRSLAPPFARSCRACSRPRS